MQQNTETSPFFFDRLTSGQ